ncbi:MAG: hypothetical protein ACFE96_16730 [Candidatus Hermodarchaeota archaeon]
MKLDEILKVCKLTKEELKEFYRNIEDIDKTLDHSRAYRTMMNQTRRELLKFIGTNIRTMDQVKNEFKSEAGQLDYHLSMLAQLNYIMNTETGWKATPRGIGFLNNTIMGD